MEAPVFYDPSGRRGRVSKRVLLGLILLILLAAIGFATTILNVPAPDPLQAGVRAPAAALAQRAGRAHPPPGRTPPSTAGSVDAQGRPAHRQTRPQVVGFYVPWDESEPRQPSPRISARWIGWPRSISFVTGPESRFRLQAQARCARCSRTSQHRPLILSDRPECRITGCGTARAYGQVAQATPSTGQIARQIGAMLTRRARRRRRLRFRGTAADARSPIIAASSTRRTRASCPTIARHAGRAGRR
jgi:hypothetical protein